MLIMLKYREPTNISFSFSSLGKVFVHLFAHCVSEIVQKAYKYYVRCSKKIKISSFPHSWDVLFFAFFLASFITFYFIRSLYNFGVRLIVSFVEAYLFEYSPFSVCSFLLFCFLILLQFNFILHRFMYGIHIQFSMHMHVRWTHTLYKLRIFKMRTAFRI